MELNVWGVDDTQAGVCPVWGKVLGLVIRRERVCGSELARGW